MVWTEQLWDIIYAYRVLDGGNLSSQIIHDPCLKKCRDDCIRRLICVQPITLREELLLDLCLIHDEKA